MTYQQKTLPTKVDPKEHIAALDVSKTKAEDGLKLLKIFTAETGVEPIMWGPSIIGYGISYVYVNKLADVDKGVLSEFIGEGYQYMQSHFNTIGRL
ncbi:hypothetical protein ACFW0C_01440 [Aerococcus sp. NPDC058936]|uniref:hypothetical protein n=1 Tax=Aerococcus sp. NPDC058936 TaxID=3346674 RepID=UPI0036730871